MNPPSYAFIPLTTDSNDLKDKVYLLDTPIQQTGDNSVQYAFVHLARGEIRASSIPLESINPQCTHRRRHKTSRTNRQKNYNWIGCI